MTTLLKNSTKVKPAWLQAVYTNDNAPLQTTKAEKPTLTEIDGEAISWIELSGDTPDMTMNALSWDNLLS